MISIKSARAEELPRGHLIALMTNDSRRSVTRRRPKIGSGEAAAPHSTPWGCPFASPRNRPDVASFHVPHPHVCGPQSHWDRCTSLHIRGARGPLRWRFHHRPLKYSCGEAVSSPLDARISSKFVFHSAGFPDQGIHFKLRPVYLASGSLTETPVYPRRGSCESYVD